MMEVGGYEYVCTPVQSIDRVSSAQAATYRGSYLFLLVANIQHWKILDPQNQLLSGGQFQLDTDEWQYTKFF